MKRPRFSFADWSPHPQNLVVTLENCEAAETVLLSLGETLVDLVVYAPWRGIVLGAFQDDPSGQPPTPEVCSLVENLQRRPLQLLQTPPPDACSAARDFGVIGSGRPPAPPPFRRAAACRRILTYTPSTAGTSTPPRVLAVVSSEGVPFTPLVWTPPPCFPLDLWSAVCCVGGETEVCAPQGLEDFSLEDFLAARPDSPTLPPPPPGVVGDAGEGGESMTWSPPSRLETTGGATRTALQV